MPYVFDLDTLTRLAEAGHGQFAGADPYPHIVIDGFLRPRGRDHSVSPILADAIENLARPARKPWWSRIPGNAGRSESRQLES